MTRVKICGITSVADALAVSESGADAVGLVFYHKSPRNIELHQAAEICKSLPPFIKVVGLFLNARPVEVKKVLDRVPLDLLQFHGSETPEYCSSFPRPFIKAVGMKGMNNLHDFSAYAKQFSDAKAFLLDSHAPGEAGGTGETFDWNHLPADFPVPIILAGGLKPDNVAQALGMADVYAVDVSSGVESKPGVKDHKKIQVFMQEVKRVER